LFIIKDITTISIMSMWLKGSLRKIISTMSMEDLRVTGVREIEVAVAEAKAMGMVTSNMVMKSSLCSRTFRSLPILAGFFFAMISAILKRLF